MTGTTISHYRIETQLGRGGMGTVYRAVDTRLGRVVALKFLRSDLSDRSDALERFRREARAISALNHSNICTLYDIGESDQGPFLTMEYVEGQTLRELLPRKKFESTEVVEIAAQVADALDAAHSAGFVHRDIKPSNIMLTSRGQVKILDFGIAKTRRVASGQASTRPNTQTETITLLEDLTTDGSVTGTLPFISPEQIRGAEADGRSDVFSLGATLYEVATGKRAFTGDTPAEVIASILEKHPLPPAKIAPGVPPGLNDVIVTALEKDPGTRYQSAAEMRAALLRVKRHESLAHASIVAADANSRSRNRFIAFAVLIAACIAAAAVGYRMLQLRRIPVYEHMTMSRLTASGTAVTSAISPDGRYLAYAAEEAGKQSLRVRQVGTNSEVPVSAPANAQYRHLAFSPDGNMLLYNIAPASLYAVPTLGGTPKLLNSNVDSAVTFSPDGKQIAFERRYPRTKQSSILIAQADGTGERSVATRTDPFFFLQGVSWSPDGTTLVCTAGVYGPTSQYASLVTIPVAGGAERSITDKKWYLAADPVWLHHGRGVIVQGAEQAFGPAQIWYIPYPKGHARRVTNDLNNYTGISLTADSSAFVTVQLERNSNIWVSQGEKSQPVQVTSGGSALDGFTGISWAPDGRIVFSSRAGGGFDIWIMNADGTNRTQLTRNAGQNAQPRVSPDGRYIVFTSDRSTGKPHIWRMDLNGDNPKQLTYGDAEHVPDCCIDGKWIVFANLGGTKLWRAPLEGGKAESLGSMVVRTPIISPDSRHVAFNYFGDPDSPHRGVGVADARNGQIEHRYPIRNDDPSEPHVGYRPMAWRYDSRALLFLRDGGNVSNIWTQALDAREPVQLTHYSSGRIFGFASSADGQRLALATGNLTRDVILIRNDQ
jgi:eukaryotic-like serine/threonine-protein kinase